MFSQLPALSPLVRKLFFGASQVFSLGGCAAQPLARPAMLKAVHYFGDEGPLNFWSSSFRHAERDFARIRSDGFNAVILVVPWSQFQPAIAPLRYDETAFERLCALTDRANRQGLGVILRVAYAWGFAPDAQPGDIERRQQLFTHAPVREAWLDYMAQLRERLGERPGLWFEFISWEDRYDFVGQAAATTDPHERRQLAEASGFADYARSRGLEPTIPDRHDPRFKALLEFVDQTEMERFFLPAQAHLPDLSMEVRVDADPIFDQGAVAEWLWHRGTYALPGAKVTTAYYSSAMGARNEGDQEGAHEALARQATILRDLAQGAGERQVFLDQYNFFDNTSGYERNTRLAPDQVNRFVTGSAVNLRAYTNGYGLWTYRDYAANMIYNPDFALGARGWATDGALQPGRQVDDNRLLLGPGQFAAQAVPLSRDLLGAPDANLTLSLALERFDPRASLDIQVGTYHHLAPLAGCRGELKLSLPARLASYDLRLAVRDGAVTLGRVRLYKFVQHGNVYDEAWNPLGSRDAVRKLNELLETPTPS